MIYGGLYLLLYCTYSLWRKFNCVKIPQGEANKSANRWGSFGAKGGVVPPLVFIQLLTCANQIHSSYTTLLLISTCDSGDPRLQHTVMEFVDLLSLVLVAVMAVVFAAVVFIFLHRWSWLGNGEALQKEKTAFFGGQTGGLV
jgi:hypothetical protein